MSRKTKAMLESEVVDLAKQVSVLTCINQALTKEFDAFVAAKDDAENAVMAEAHAALKAMEDTPPFDPADHANMDDAHEFVEQSADDAPAEDKIFQRYIDDQDGRIEGSYRCYRCSGTGRWITRIENGKPLGPDGHDCFRCDGKSHHTQADRKRNYGYALNQRIY